MSDKKFQLINGDAEKVLSKFPDNFFQCCTTSPPYFKLRDYFEGDQLGQEETPEEYIERLVRIMREVKRTLRPDGVCWLNIGDSYNSSSGFIRNKGKWKRKGRENGSADKKALKHPDIKTKDLMGIPWSVAFALRKDGWYLRQDVIWCLSGGTKLYAEINGSIKNICIRDMSRLDFKNIKLWNGKKWTKIINLSISPRTGKEMSFELRSGERIACTLGHFWPTKRGLIEAVNLKIGDVVEKCILPESNDCISPESLPDEDMGWLVGMYLAEGSKSRRRGKTKNIQISSHKKEMNRYHRLKKITDSFGGFCTKYSTSDNGMTINIHSSIIESIIDTYIGGRTAKTKHLKPICWNRNNDFLKNLLQGYLDGDGHWEPKNKRWRIGFTRNYSLERDLRTICARLGYKIKLSLSVSKIKDKEYKSFRGEIRFETSNHFNNKEETEIVEIKYTDGGGRLFYYDIEVKDDPHLFSLSSGVLTHNSKDNPLPDGAKDRPCRSHEYIFQLTKSSKYFYDYFAIMEDSVSKRRTGGGFGAKVQEGTFRMDQDRTFTDYGVRQKRSVWSHPVSRSGKDHYATYTIELINDCVASGVSEKGCCPQCRSPWKRKLKTIKILKENPISDNVENDIFSKTVPQINLQKEEYVDKLIFKGWEPTCKCGIKETIPCLVLDPFNGSGTTGVVAHLKNADYVGIDLNKKYIELSRKRLQKDIFTEEVNFNE